MKRLSDEGAEDEDGGRGEAETQWKFSQIVIIKQVNNNTT